MRRKQEGDDDFISTLADGYEISFSNPDGDVITTSFTENDLKKYIHVTQNGIEINDFNVKIPNGFLTEGNPSVDIILDSTTVGSASLSGVSADRIESIAVDHDSESAIYTTSSDEDIKKALTVTVNYVSGKTVVLDSDQYSIGWNHLSGEQSIGISFTYLGEVCTQSVEVDIIALSLTEIRAEIPEGTIIYSYMNQAMLNEAVVVTGMFNDGVSRSLPFMDNYDRISFDYNVVGSLMSGELRHDEDTNKYYADLIVTSTNNSAINYDLGEVEVTPSTPIEIEADWEGSFNGHEAYSRLDPSQLTVTLTYVDSDNREIKKKLNNTDYTLTYSDVEVGGDQSFRVPSNTKYATVTVTVVEFEKEFTDLITGFEVIPAKIDRPTLSSGIFTYDGDEHTWQIFGYDSSRMVLELPNGMESEVKGGITFVKATNAGDYTVIVKPKNSSITWSDGKTEDTTLGPVQILPTSIIVSLELSSSSITYGDKYAATLKVFGLNGTAMEIDDKYITYTYRGTNKLNQEVNGEGLPQDAGDWTVIVSVGKQGNYSSGVTTANISIEKQSLQTPNLSDKVYNGVSQIPELATSSTLYYVNNPEDNARTNVGNYSVILIISNYNNYRWDKSDSANLDVEWSITKDRNTFTKDLNIVDWTYGSNPSIPSASTKYPGDITYEYSSDGNNYTDVVTVWTAGTWYVRAVSAGTSNYDSVTTESVSFEIFRMPVPVPNVTVGSYEYTGSPITVDVEGLKDTEYYTVLGNTGTEVDNYTLTLEIKDNYRWDVADEDSQLSDKQYSWSIHTSTNTIESITVEQAGCEYGQTPLIENIVVKTKFGGEVTLLYSKNNPSGAYGPAPTTWTAGTWYIKVVSAESDNYDSDSKEVQHYFIITKHGFTPPTEDTREFKYTGKDQQYIPAGFN